MKPGFWARYLDKDKPYAPLLIGTDRLKLKKKGSQVVATKEDQKQIELLGSFPNHDLTRYRKPMRFGLITG